jgi:hypothetical protein
MSAFDYEVTDEVDWTSFDKNLVIEKVQLKTIYYCSRGMGAKDKVRRRNVYFHGVGDW